jgi:hypothetical protein
MVSKDEKKREGSLNVSLMCFVFLSHFFSSHFSFLYPSLLVIKGAGAGAPVATSHEEQKVRKDQQQLESSPSELRIAPDSSQSKNPHSFAIAIRELMIVPFDCFRHTI